MNTRQQKVAKQIQKDMAEILRVHTPLFAGGKMLTVTNVRITPDLGTAKVYVSVFPSDNAPIILEKVRTHTPQLRNELGQKIRHQLKKVPEISFYLDDSLDYIDNIDNLLNS